MCPLPYHSSSVIIKYECVVEESKPRVESCVTAFGQELPEGGESPRRLGKFILSYRSNLRYAGDDGRPAGCLELDLSPSRGRADALYFSASSRLCPLSSRTFPRLEFREIKIHLSSKRPKRDWTFPWALICSPGI